MKKRLLPILAVSLTLSSFLAASAEDDIKILLNGSYLEFDAAPEIVQDRTFVPLRAIAEALDSTVNWIEDSKSIELTKGNVTTVLSIGSTDVSIRTADTTQASTIDAEPYIKNDRTMVPLRFISESFGMNVDWDGDTRTVTVSDSDTSAASAISPTEIDLNSVSYYSDFETIPDFGACFGYTGEDRENNVHFYAGTSEADRKGYQDLLQSLGFEQVDEMVNSQVEGYAYEKDSLLIVTAFYHIEGMEKLYGLMIQTKPESFSGEIKYYNEYEKVPDFGMFEKVSQIGTDNLAENMTKYSYSVSDPDDLNNILVQYIEILLNCGFSTYYEYLNTAMYTNSDTRNSVTLSNDLDSNNNIIINVTVEQWSENSEN
jgi:hypothetical protein